jgi:hypothetical protein
MLFLFNRKRLVITDSKNELQEWNVEDFSSSALRKIRNGDDIRVRAVYNNEVGEALNAAYEAGNINVYIDEATSVIRTKENKLALEDIWQRGRSRNVGGWISSQRPSGIPLELISEGNHFFCFRLLLDRDRSRMSEFMGNKVLSIPQDKYGFYYRNIEREYTQYFSKINT